MEPGKTTWPLVESFVFIVRRSHHVQRLFSENGGAGESRTPDTQFRKLLLYPSELQPRAMIVLQKAGPSFDPPAGFVDRARSRWMRARISCGVSGGDWSAENHWPGPGGWEAFAAGDSCCRTGSPR